MSREIIFYILIVFFPDCQNQNQTRFNNPYDIKINYIAKNQILPNEILNSKYLNNDKLYIYFEEHFDNDTIKVKINNEIYKEQIISTDPSTGLALSIEIDSINNINDMSVSLNGGREANFKVDISNQISINFLDSILNIDFLKNVPYYD